METDMADFWDFLKDASPSKSATLAEVAADAEVAAVFDAVVGFGPYRAVQLLLKVRGCTGGAVADKLDVFVDRSADGIGWVNVAHFTQVDGNASTPMLLAVVLDHTTPGFGNSDADVDVSADLAESIARPWVMGDQFRVRSAQTVVSEPAPTWSWLVEAHGE
jgi:hypothetical protein